MKPILSRFRFKPTADLDFRKAMLKADLDSGVYFHLISAAPPATFSERKYELAAIELHKYSNANYDLDKFKKYVLSFPLTAEALTMQSLYSRGLL